MLKVIVLQIGVTVITAIASGMLAGAKGALSAAAGGVACIIPNLLFALRLQIVMHKAAPSYVAEFFVGEFLKVASTVGLLLLAVNLIDNVQWLALLVGVIAALKANLFAFLSKS